MDKYTKFILTVIAILLALHLVKPWFIPYEVKAGPGIIDVNIEKVGGSFVNVSAGIPVHIVK
ncbi:MAG: hypothetical protein ACFFCW_33685 [Candidatus Hodarchaeota archaeon]